MPRICPELVGTGTQRNGVTARPVSPTCGVVGLICRNRVFWSAAGRPLSVMDLYRTPVAPEAEGVSRAPMPGPAASWLLMPWTVEDVCAFLRCTDRWLRKVRSDSSAGFPPPLRTAQLAWWPGDVLAWCGISLADALSIAQSLDVGNSQSASSAGDER